MESLFVTGMLRSGTSLIQVLLTNHPQIFVAYQPYFQFYVSVKQQFLEEQGRKTLVPLGDGLDSSDEERKEWSRWLKVRKFDSEETSLLIAQATTGKGGSAHGFTEAATFQPGSFVEIQRQLHKHLSMRFLPESSKFVGAKEVLCEEYIPALVEAGGHCLIIIRDPRAVIASACHGRYVQQVGDKYPLLMLIRLWRKSAGYWLAFRNHPLIHSVHYEDIVQNSDSVLRKIEKWLNIEAFPEGLIKKPLYDHTGKIWKGNSSFGDKETIDGSSRDNWRTLLTTEEVRFIEACTKPELDALGYSYSADLTMSDISEFIENTQGVRDSYLTNYGLSLENRQYEIQRFKEASHGNYSGKFEKNLFLFPTVFSAA
jgi:hypothetical protein